MMPAMHLSVTLLPQPEAPSKASVCSRVVKLCLQGKVSQPFFDFHPQTHARRLLLPPSGCLRSKRFTASSTTAEMATFTSTHRKASASSPVHQS